MSNKSHSVPIYFWPWKRLAHLVTISAVGFKVLHIPKGPREQVIEIGGSSI